MARALSTLAALGLLAGCGSSQDEAGIEVALRLRPPATPLVEGERRFTSDLGYTIRLTRGYLSIQSADLVACAGARRRSFSLIREAHAHGTGSPTRLGLGSVERLLAPPGEPRSLGVFSPPPGRYCAISFGLRVADEDAEGLPADVPFVGQTILVEGFYTAAGSPEERPFRGVTTASATGKAAMDAVDLGERRALLLTGAWGEAWFQGVELASLGEEQIGRGVLQNIASTFRVEAP
ncbi:MAG: hypothetical protein MUF64_17600 [Polyangiaceae bacterium]|jgi:hypothetical protein|nr:hypothetical protein [Polyangiaceae bacterium]